MQKRKAEVEPEGEKFLGSRRSRSNGKSLASSQVILTDLAPEILLLIIKNLCNSSDKQDIRSIAWSCRLFYHLTLELRQVCMHVENGSARLKVLQYLLYTYPAGLCTALRFRVTNEQSKLSLKTVKSLPAIESVLSVSDPYLMSKLQKGYRADIHRLLLNFVPHLTLLELTIPEGGYTPLSEHLNRLFADANYDIALFQDMLPPGLKSLKVFKFVKPQKFSKQWHIAQSWCLVPHFFLPSIDSVDYCGQRIEMSYRLPRHVHNSLVFKSSVKLIHICPCVRLGNMEPILKLTACLKHASQNHDLIWDDCQRRINDARSNLDFSTAANYALIYLELSPNGWWAIINADFFRGAILAEDLTLVNISSMLLHLGDVTDHAIIPQRDCTPSRIEAIGEHILNQIDGKGSVYFRGTDSKWNLFEREQKSVQNHE
jgi:hypothetical protein